MTARAAEHTRRDAGTWVAAIAVLFVARSADAQGLTGGLAGLREAYFLFWGVVGIVPAVLLAIAHARAKKRGPNGLSTLLALPAIVYAPTAVALIFIPSTDLASKVPGVVGFGLLFGLAAYYLPKHPRLRWSVNGALAVVLVSLVSISNDYWKVRFLSFEHVEFVDNVAPRELVETLRSRSAPDGWLALVDGRHLVQDPSGRRRDSRGQPTFPRGDRVALETAQGDGRGTWYHVTFFSKTYRYALSASHMRARYVIPLSTRSENMYQESGTSFAVLVDDTARLDYDRMLAEVLQSANGWSSEPDAGDVASAGYWVKELTPRAGLELDSPELLTHVYRQKEIWPRLSFLIDAGVSPNAVDEDGNSMLHAAARDGDVYALRALVDAGADVRLTNRKGRTALHLARVRHGRSPRTTPIKTIEELLERPQ